MAFSLPIAPILLRLTLLVVILFWIYLKTSSPKTEKSLINEFIVFFVLFIATLIPVGILLLHIGMYDVLLLFTLIGFYFISRLFDFQSKAAFKKSVRKVHINTVYRLSARINSLKAKKVTQKIKTFSRKDLSIPILLALIIGVVVLVFRFIYVDSDQYLLSEAWYTDLYQLQRLENAKIWDPFSTPLSGEYFLIHLYSDFMGLPLYLALCSFGVLQTLFLSLIVYWAISEVCHKNYYLGFLAGIMMAGFFTVLPIDTGLLLQHKPIFTALIFALPAYVFYAKPELISAKKKTYFWSMFSLFMAISLTHLLINIYITLPFLILFYSLSPKNKNSLKRQANLAFLLTLGITGTMLYLRSVFVGENFATVIDTVLSSIETQSNISHLAIPYDTLLTIYITISAIGLLFGILLYAKDRNRYALPLTLLLVGMILMIVPKKFTFFDLDSSVEIYVVLIPVVLTISGFFMVKTVHLFFTPTKNFAVFKPLWLIPALGGLIWVNPWDGSSTTLESNSINTEIIQAYNQISKKRIPYSYAVINTSENQMLSTKSHHFISYDFFIDAYLEKDSLYKLNQNNPQYFKEYPQNHLPPSTFVFVYEEKAWSDYDRELQPKTQKQILENLKKLKEKERAIELFYQSTNLKVYSILNDPKSGKTNELLVTHTER